jgi:thiol-disulfide isomerase/thioredoxin
VASAFRTRRANLNIRRQAENLATRKQLLRLALLALLGLPLAGCSKSDDKEVSAETSGYQVADGDSPAKPSDSDSAKSNPSDTAPPASTNQDLANQAAKPPATAGDSPAPVNKAGTMPDAGNTTPAATPPGLATPGGAAPGERTGGVVNEAPSFATLQYPTSEDAAELVAFLIKSDQAIRDLAVWGSQGMIPEAQFRQQGARVLEMKLTAANKLIEKKDLAEKDLGIARKAKLQALSQLSGLGDVRANDALRAYVEEVVKSGDPELVHNAKLMQMGYAAESLMGGKSKDPSELLSRIDEVLADENYRGAVELMQVRQATGLLEQMGYNEQASAVRQKLGKMFENNKDPNLANAAWQILAEQHPATNALRDAIGAIMKGEASATDQIKAAAEKMIAELPSERTILFLVSQIINIEYSGQPATAAVLVDVISANLDKITDPAMKEQVVKTFESFKLRQAIVGKEISFTGLLDTAGKPLDWSAYSGKVVMVDFWATWCQPCLQELPNMEKAYNALKEKGFEIVGINLDDTDAELKGFLQQKSLPWTTLRSSDPAKSGLATPLAVELGVEAIPFVLLIGKDGKVAKLHARGEQLIPAIEELLK